MYPEYCISGEKSYDLPSGNGLPVCGTRTANRAAEKFDMCRVYFLVTSKPLIRTNILADKKILSMCREERQTDCSRSRSFHVGVGLL
jgi:hypothetical protein